MDFCLQARPILMCPQLIFSTPVSLNKSAPTNLYHSQKLLSVSVDLSLPVLPIQERVMLSPFQNLETDQTIDDLPNSYRLHNDWSVSTKLALAIMTMAALILFYQFYRNRTRPRRTRKSPRLKRVVAPLPSPTPSVKTPTV